MSSIYVGNLSFTTTEDELRQAFSQHGAVSEVKIVTDRETGRPRGFAFVEMSNNNEAANAIKELNFREIGGRAITVNEARPKTDKPPRRAAAAVLGVIGKRTWGLSPSENKAHSALGRVLWAGREQFFRFL